MPSGNIYIDNKSDNQYLIMQYTIDNNMQAPDLGCFRPSNLYHDCFTYPFHQLIALRPTLLLPTGMRS